MRGDDGFTLVEAVCVLAIVALIALIALPRAPSATSAEGLRGYAVAIAAMLKGDRNAAIGRGAPVSTALSAASRSVRSGAGGGALRLPDDVAFDAMLAQRCNGRPAGATIDFFPDGLSCGGVIALSRLGAAYQIRVNWLTGGVEIVESHKS
jgi:general secretion pathway protein H